MSVVLIEVGSEAYIDMLRAATIAGYDFAKEIYQAENDMSRTISREEAMKPHMLNCKKSKLQNLISEGKLQVTETKPQHITVKSINDYKKSKIRK